MIMRLIRIMLCSGAVYLFIRVGYPEPGNNVYQVLVILGILGGAGVLTVALRLLEFASAKLPALLEAAFIVAVIVVLGFTMPAKGGPALPQVLEGDLPTQSSVREGLAQLGVDANSPNARKLIGLFRK
ncbi:MAG: hypothetical protein HY927_03710 [Elusimicrobia bacterium]|nr:hypothetical protein [Elusimicrobiota bacterium]